MKSYVKSLIAIITTSFIIVSEISFAQDNSDVTFDKKAVATKRVAPQMPSKAKTSGYCCVFVLFIITSGVLYLYSTYLKRIALIGNVVIAGLVSLSLLLVGIFDLLLALMPLRPSPIFSTNWLVVA